MIQISLTDIVGIALVGLLTGMTMCLMFAGVVSWVIDHKIRILIEEKFKNTEYKKTQSEDCETSDLKELEQEPLK